MHENPAGSQRHQDFFSRRSTGMPAVHDDCVGAEHGDLVDHLVMRFGVRPARASAMADDVLKIIASGVLDGFSASPAHTGCGGA